MEKFMFLFRGSDVYQPGQSPAALEALKLRLIDWINDLSKKGVHVASQPLMPGGMLVNGSKKVVTEEPFGEDRAIIGGCTIVLADDIHGAMDIAMGCPILESNASIEVRPLQKMDM